VKLKFIGKILTLLAEPNQPHAIPPTWGAHAAKGGLNAVPSPLISQRKLLPTNLKYEALEIS